MQIRLLLFALLVFIYINIPSNAFAADFDIKSHDTYKVFSSGAASVSHSVSITNKKEFVYTPTYSLSFPYSDAAGVKAVSGSVKYKIETEGSGSNRKLVVSFPKKIIGQGTQNKFTVTYDTNQIVNLKKSGIEVVIPPPDDPEMFSSYVVDVVIPESFGYATKIHPTNIGKTGGTYTFQLKNTTKGINMFFNPDAHISETIEIRFPDNVIFGFPITGSVLIRNQTAETLFDKELEVTSDLGVTKKYKVKRISPKGSIVIPIDLGTTPFLTMKKIAVKISFDGNNITHNINIGFFPDYYLIILGGVIFFGSIIVAVATAKTWRIYIQKRKK